MYFRYTALNEENKQMTGVLEADSMDVAQDELHKMNLSILTINNISEEEYSQEKVSAEKELQKSGIKIYRFVGMDTKNQEINGTIDAKDPYGAYRRLVASYHFKVTALYPENASEAEKSAWEKDFAGNIEKWNEQLDDDGVDLEKSTKAVERNKDLEEASDSIDQRVVEEIDQFIINTKRVLTVHNQQFSASFLAEIQKVLGELERIRTSNNIRHITEICNQLYELVSHPDQMENLENEDSSDYMEIINTMRQSGFVRSQFDIETKAEGLKKIKGHFSKILRKMTGSPANDAIKKPSKIQKFLRNVSKKNAKRRRAEEEVATEEKRVGLGEVIKQAAAYISAPSPILRQTRKQEMLRAFREWRQSVTKTLTFYRIKAMFKRGGGPSSKLDLSGVFVEADGFVGWLLFFYIFYFFLVDFSLEKGIGLPRGFVVQTLKSDLVLDIVILLVFAHFMLKIKNEFFRRGFLAPVFLFSLGFSFYAAIIINL